MGATRVVVEEEEAMEGTLQAVMVHPLLEEEVMDTVVPVASTLVTNKAHLRVQTHSTLSLFPLGVVIDMDRRLWQVRTLSTRMPFVF